MCACQSSTVCVPSGVLSQCLTMFCASVPGTRSGCRNLEEGGCSLYWYCRQKPSGAQGEYVYLIFIHITTSMLLILGFHVSLQDYKPEEDPCKYKSVKTGRGPLGPDWKVQSYVLWISSFRNQQLFFFKSLHQLKVHNCGHQQFYFWSCRDKKQDSHFCRWQ